MENEIEPTRILSVRQESFDVDAEIFEGDERTEIGRLTEITRVQDESGWVIKYYIRIREPTVEASRLPLNNIRRSIFPYGTITLQRNEELMLITIDFSPYKRPVSQPLQGWIDFVKWHYNYCLSDNSASLLESEYGFGI